MLFADSTHTASPPWSLICTVLSKQSWKWAQPTSSNNTPSKLLNSLYLPGHYKSFNIYKAFWNCPCHKPSWLFASILGTLTKLAVIFPQFSAHSLALPMSHQHFSVCTQRKHWQHRMQHIFCNCALDPQQVLNFCESARRLLGTTTQIKTPQ